jgi:translation initiation factor IF-3
MQQSMNRQDNKDNKWYRVNRQIRFSPVMVILNDQNLGTMPTERAFELAQSEGLDLVEIAPHARPPVCKIIDYGKFKYEQSMKEKKAKQSKAKPMKELVLSPVTADHDLETKANAAKRFLESGHKVQVKVKFRNRENAHKDLGFTMINKVIALLQESGKTTKPPQLDGKFVSCLIEPK